MNTLLTPLKKIFFPPRFADEEKNHRIRTLWRIILISLAGSVIFGITSSLMRWGGVIPFVSAAYALLALGCLWLIRQGWLDLPGILLPSVLLVLVTFQTIRNHGPHDQAILIYPLIITFAWLLLNRRMALMFLILSLSSVFLVIYLEVNGFIMPHVEGASEYSDIITFAVVFGSIALLVDTVTDNLRVALKRLQKNEARLRGLVENSPDFILEINRAGKILFINRLSEMYIGKNVRDVLPSDQLEYGLEMIERTFSSEQPVFAELRTDMPDARIVWDAVRMGPIKQGDVVTSITVVMTDISIQKSAETALRESEARITNALIAGGVVPYINDYRIKRFTFISENVSRLTGYGAAEITPAILKNSVEEDHMWGPNAKLSTAEARQRVQAGEPLEWRSDLRIRTATGESRWISDISTEILDESGKAIGGIGILQDITERKRTESALRASEEQYRTFISLSAEAIYHFEMDEPISIDLPEEKLYSKIIQGARVAECNDVFARLYGYTNAEELKGKRLVETNAVASPSDKDAIVQSIRSGFRLIDFESSEILADGNSYFFLSNLVGIFESGFLVGTWGNVRNITDRKRAEVEREKLVVELENRNAELERFNYTLSHELKTPLVTLGFYSGALENDIKIGNQERVSADLNRIIKASSKMHKITSELLELSSLDRRTFDFEDTSFERIVHDGLKQAAKLIKERNVQIQYSSNLPTVKADRKRMIEVIQNLADNAIKYMGDQTEPLISIGVRDEGNVQVFFVKDNGIGIDAAYHERVFGLFDKLNPQSEGTGIGLTLVKRIIETHGGRIWVESEGLGKGSTFCFTIPDGRK